MTLGHLNIKTTTTVATFLCNTYHLLTTPHRPPVLRQVPKNLSTSGKESKHKITRALLGYVTTVTKWSNREKCCISNLQRLYHFIFYNPILPALLSSYSYYLHDSFTLLFPPLYSLLRKERNLNIAMKNTTTESKRYLNYEYFKYIYTHISWT